MNNQTENYIHYSWSYCYSILDSLFRINLLQHFSTILFYIVVVERKQKVCAAKTLFLFYVNNDILRLDYVFGNNNSFTANWVRWNVNWAESNYHATNSKKEQNDKCCKYNSKNFSTSANLVVIPINIFRFRNFLSFYIQSSSIVLTLSW